MTEARLFGGRYEIGNVLGYGGMAEVHMGRDHRLGRDVAIKVLRSDLARDPGFQARFRREAQNAASLNHPAIVSVYDTGEDPSARDGVAVPYIVMEYVEGLTLKEVLTAEGRLAPQRALEIVADVCAALDFSHDHGIIHRDIKPGNVMLTPQGAVKVMDFGIARAITSASSQMTATSAVIGTAQYLSPEQARGETVDARSDVYSTGCLLYELLVGEPPFTGDNPVSVAYQHVREDPIPPSQRNPEISATIDSLVLKAMAKNPAARYQSAGEMRADLLRAAAGRPVAAAPIQAGGDRTAVLGGGGAATRVVPGPGGYQTSVGGAHTDAAAGRRRSATIAVAILAVVALVAVVAFAASKLGGGGGKEVTVANVVGQLEALAKRELEGQGLQVSSRTVDSDAAQKGKVIEQNPAANSTAKEGDKVEISIGGGPEEVTVPDLTRTNQEGAEQQLKALKLEVKVEEDDSNDEPEGSVTRQDPEAKSKLPEGGTVTIWVSKANLTLVPDVRGAPIGEATSTLTAAGFRVSRRNVASDSQPAGTVISQTPEQGSKRSPKSTITLTVSSGPAASESPDPDPTPSEDNEPSEPTEPTESTGATASPDANASPARGTNSLLTR